MVERVGSYAFGGTNVKSPTATTFPDQMGCSKQREGSCLWGSVAALRWEVRGTNAE